MSTNRDGSVGRMCWPGAWRYAGLLAICGSLLNVASAESPSNRLVPEWELTGPLVMVWPEFVSGQRALVEAYTAWIRSLPDDVDVALVSPRPPRRQSLSELGRSVRYIPLSEVDEVALRLWGGVAGARPDGRLFRVLGRYAPGHLAGRAIGRAARDAASGEELARMLYTHMQNLDLHITGTQFVHNGHGVGFMSNRVIAENQHWSLARIQILFREQFGVDRLVFVPVPEASESGSIDGMIRFVGPDQVLVAQTPEPLSQYLYDLVRKHVGEDATVHAVSQVPDTPLGAVWGNYLHLVHLDGVLWLPTYGTADDARVRDQLEHAFPDLDVRYWDNGGRIIESSRPWSLYRTSLRF